MIEKYLSQKETESCLRLTLDGHPVTLTIGNNPGGCHHLELGPQLLSPETRSLFSIHIGMKHEDMTRILTY